MTINGTKKTIRQTMRFVESSYAQVVKAATIARMSVPDFLIASALMVMENKIRPITIENTKPSRQTITAKLTRYFELESERTAIQSRRCIILNKINQAVAKIGGDFRNSTFNDLELEQLYHDLHVCDLALLDPENGYGLLQDVSDLLTGEKKLNLCDAGTDNHFLLATPMGAASVPLKIVASEIWLGGLPPNCVVYLNNRRVGI